MYCTRHVNLLLADFSYPVYVWDLFLHPQIIWHRNLF